MGMMASERNRGILDADNPCDDDGFSSYRRFKQRGKSGLSGKRPLRRNIRAKEKVRWIREWF